MAYVVGVMLLVLVLVAMPLKYLAHNETPVAVIGPVHGFLYVLYLLTALDLAVRMRWKLLTTLAVFAAGTIPFLSFVAEHRVTARVRGEGVGTQTR